MFRCIKKKLQGRPTDDILLTHRLLTRKISRLPLAGKLVLGFSLVFSIFLYGYIGYLFFGNDLKGEGMLEVNKCPACYGNSYCYQLKQGHVSLEGWDRVRLLDYVNVKNVYYGAQGLQKVVLKKLAHNQELAQFDADMCKSVSSEPDCDVSQAVYRSLGLSGYSWIKRKVADLSDMTRCPTQRLVDRIINRYKEKVDAVDMRSVEKMFLVTTLMINPEPLMLQAFPVEEGWPFPEYFGACGRFVVVQNVGETLETYYNAPWMERADYALQILKIAERFTENESGFSLYWTDLGYQNLAVSQHGRVIVIDAENIMVVDTWQIKQDKQKGWDEPYYSEFDECQSGLGTCLGFNVDWLCSRSTVDHNYYAACRNLLSSYGSDTDKPGGLLHDTPSDVEEKYHLSNMLNECAKPSSAGNRLMAKENLMKALEKIVFGNES